VAELQEVTFTDLLQRPTETVEKLKQSRGRALRVHRRGTEDDLILTTAARATQDGELVDVAIRLLRAIMSNPVMRSTHLLDVLPQVFPWIRFLPADDRVEFVRELIDVMSASAEVDSPTPALQVITEWRNTAQVYADPELLEILRSQAIEDAGDVTAPHA
jgi:glyceraldehyde-3-phosphate dehydrogenase/erythrose-4-phosphate dehydrogenase